MPKILLFLLGFQLLLFSYSDYDLDGIDDSYDRCPNTPFSELVDAYGCTTSSLISAHKFDIIYGMSYTSSDYSGETTNTNSHGLQFDYYYKDFSLEISTSYYNSTSVSYNDNGANDSFVGAYYQFLPIKNLKIKTGLGFIIPTYDSELNNNNTDYTGTISLSYALDKVNLFIGYNYTKINDDDLNTDIIVNYQDTNSFNLGIGFYPSQKLYLSSSYFNSDSVYVDVEKINTVSVYAFYTLNSRWFTTLNYSHGLSDSASDTYLSMKVGYNF
ncbi:MAG: transporter [Thiovulaceae bacterium]|nr:transporter [Sulfurimonadaceae bacterium]